MSGESAGACPRRSSEITTPYKVPLREGSTGGGFVANRTVAESKLTTPTLARARYTWRVAACHTPGCGNGTPRSVDVIATTVAVLSNSMRDGRLKTGTGRRLSGRGRSRNQFWSRLNRPAYAAA